MAKLKSRMRLPFTRFAAILRTVLCLSMMLVLAQVVDPDSDSGAKSKSNPNPNSNSGSVKRPQVDTITKVPGTISDLACDTGRRNVVKVYKNGALMKTERGDCV